MSDQAIAIELEPRPGADVGSLDALGEAINDEIWDLMSRYAGGDACDAIWQDYVAAAQASEHLERDGMTLRFGFPTADRRRSASIARYWFRLGVAASRDRLDELTSDAGVFVTGERESIREVIDDRPAVIQSRGELWLVEGAAGSPTLVGDSNAVEPTADERERTAAVLGGGQSEDPVWRMFAPADDFASAMCGAIADAEPEIASTALWYLGNSARPDDATIGAMFDAAGSASDEVVAAARRALGRLARHVPMTDAVRARVEHADPGIRAAALESLPALQERGELEVAEVGDALLAGLEAEPPALDAAAASLGYVKLEAYRGRVVRALCELLGRGCPAEAAHNAVLSLVNIHLPTRQIDADVRAALEREAGSEAEHAGLAQWALQMFAPQ